MWQFAKDHPKTFWAVLVIALVWIAIDLKLVDDLMTGAYVQIAVPTSPLTQPPEEMP